MVKQFDARQTTKDSVPYSEFMDAAKSGSVESASGRRPDDQVGHRRQQALTSPTVPATSGWSATWSSTASRSRPSRRKSSRFLAQIFISWFPMLLLIGVWIFFMRQMQGGGRGGAFSFGKSTARMLDESNNTGHLRRRRRLR